jgi:hypothetical protein
MKHKKISNSKYRNTGVLFELLVRQITSDTLSGRPVSEALNIMKKYFNASTELGKEMQLYRAFFEAGKLTETRALHFIDLITEQRKKLDERKLSREKYELVKAIKNAYPLKEFLQCRVPQYTIHASIYKTFASQIATKDNTANITNISEIATAKFTLVEHLVGIRKTAATVNETAALMEEFKSQSEDLRLLSYKLVVDRFNDKYSTLNDRQKGLLREYINNVSDTNSLLKYAKKELPAMKRDLIAKAKSTTDKVMSIKLSEVASQLEKIGSKNVIKDNEVTAMMIALEILKEPT